MEQEATLRVLVRSLQRFDFCLKDILEVKKNPMNGMETLQVTVLLP